MISNTLYQNIYEELSKYMAPGWEKLVVYLEYGAASYSFSFYIKKKNEYIKCYDLPYVTDDDLVKSFKEIDKFVSKERDKENEPWTNMTMVVDNAGNMRTDFDFTDLLQDSYQYRKRWKEKYLN